MCEGAELKKEVFPLLSTRIHRIHRFSFHDLHAMMAYKQREAHSPFVQIGGNFFIPFSKPLQWFSMPRAAAHNK